MMLDLFVIFPEIWVLMVDLQSVMRW